MQHLIKPEKTRFIQMHNIAGDHRNDDCILFSLLWNEVVGTGRVIIVSADAKVLGCVLPWDKTTRKSVKHVAEDAACHQRSGPHISRTTLGVPSLPRRKRPSTLLLSPSRPWAIPGGLCLSAVPACRGYIWRGSREKDAPRRWRRPSLAFLQHLLWSSTPGPDRTGRRCVLLVCDGGADDSGTGACCILPVVSKWHCWQRELEASPYRWRASRNAALGALREDAALCLKCHGWMDGWMERVLPQSFNPANMVGRLLS